jgi:hypothetical protein
MAFKTIAEVRQANKASGNHWFDRSSMRHFNTRIESKLYKGGYFITSESMRLDPARRYTVRKALSDGSIQTVGEFHWYLRKSDAINAIIYAQMGLVK